MVSSKGEGGKLPSLPPDLKVESFPDYPFRGTGPAIVAGRSLSLWEDLFNARREFPGATVFGINVPPLSLRCDHIAIIDKCNAKQWRERYEHVNDYFPTFYHSGRWGSKSRDEFKDIDYWWPGFQLGGTGALLATLIALAIGHNPVVLCGAPLERGRYYDGQQGQSWSTDNHIDAVRQAWERQSWLRQYVRSMSGWTKKFLTS